MKTSTLKPPAPTWHLVDAEGKTIGFLASKIAHVLRGKHRPSFSPHQLCGDHVVLVNVEKLSVTPEKGRRKTYVSHSGYLGSIKFKSLTKMMEDKPETVIEKAVYGMLPKNRLRPQMLKRLHVFTGTEHPYAAQKPSELNLASL